MNKSCLYLLICFSLLTLNTGRASFHLWDINEVYSNADGSVQFIELFTSSGGQQFVSGHTITSTGAADFTFPSNSPSPTAGHHLLIATGDINGVTPDFTIPANFLTTGPGTVNFVGADSLPYSFLPINGFSSIDGNGDIVTSATPTNFSGSTTTLTNRQRWLDAHFSDAEQGMLEVSGDSVDLTGDGINNLLAYAFDLDPRQFQPDKLPQPAIDSSGFLTINFIRDTRAVDLTYIVEASSDLSTWTELARSAGGGAPTGSGTISESTGANTRTVTVSDTEAGSERFIRLIVERQE